MKKRVCFSLVILLTFICSFAYGLPFDLSMFENDTYTITYNEQDSEAFAIELSDFDASIYMFEDREEIIAISPRVEYLSNQFTCYGIQVWMFDKTWFQVEEVAILIDDYAYILPFDFSTEQSESGYIIEYGVIPLGLDGMKMLSKLEFAEKSAVFFTGSKSNLSVALKKNNIDEMLAMFETFSDAGGINISGDVFMDELYPIEVERIE